MTDETNETWWGALELAVGETVSWQLGPLNVAVQRRPQEWLVGQTRLETQEELTEWRRERSDLDVEGAGFETLSRIVYASAPQHLAALPALADRPVVSRPFTPFTVPEGEQATIFVSTPLWFTLAAGLPPQTVFETAIQRPSDTWFGPSTQEGELCYASRTYGRLQLANLTHYAHRAITQVHVHNTGAGPLLVERLNLPVPYLSLFETAEHTLCTETVTMEQMPGAPLAALTIDRETARPGAGMRLVAAPRQAPRAGMLVRAFSTLRLPGFD